jgi:hypothetical protein
VEKPRRTPHPGREFEELSPLKLPPERLRCKHGVFEKYWGGGVYGEAAHTTTHTPTQTPCCFLFHFAVKSGEIEKYMISRKDAKT